MKKLNKHVYTWVGTFLFGFLGVDRFMRGHIKRGILKIVIGALGILGVAFLVSEGFAVDNLIGSLGVLWFFIDFIIALTKLGKYEKEFVFDYDGKWDKSYTKEGLEKAEILRKQQEEERLERERLEKERKEKYKKDIESGAISYDKEIQQIADTLSEWRSIINKKSSEMQSLVKEVTAGSMNAVKEIINMDRWFGIGDFSDKLSDLKEIKNDSRINQLKKENSALQDQRNILRTALSDMQTELRFRLGSNYNTFLR